MWITLFHSAVSPSMPIFYVCSYSSSPFGQDMTAFKTKVDWFLWKMTSAGIALESDKLNAVSCCMILTCKLSNSSDYIMSLAIVRQMFYLWVSLFSEFQNFHPLENIRFLPVLFVTPSLSPLHLWFCFGWVIFSSWALLLLWPFVVLFFGKGWLRFEVIDPSMGPNPVFKSSSQNL